MLVTNTTKYPISEEKYQVTFLDFWGLTYYVKESKGAKIRNLYNQVLVSKIVSEYDQEIPQSQTADNTVAPRGRAAQLV